MSFSFLEPNNKYWKVQILFLPPMVNINELQSNYFVICADWQTVHKQRDDMNA